MAKNIRDAAIEAIVASDPRAAATRALALVLDSVGGSEAALFRCQDAAPPQLALGLRITGEGLAVVASAWAAHGAQLRAGSPVTGSQWTLTAFPARTGYGLVYVTGAGAFHPPTAAGVVQQLHEILSLALDASEGREAAPAAVAPAGSRRPAPAQLLGLLELHEWNIARVARAVGKTRATVYAWLEAYRIPRRGGKRSGFAARPRPRTS